MVMQPCGGLIPDHRRFVDRESECGCDAALGVGGSDMVLDQVVPGTA